MRFRLLALTLVLLQTSPGAAREKAGLSGVIKDVDRGSVVWGALASLIPGRLRTVSDRQGRFDFPCRFGRRYRISVELAGYETTDVSVTCPDGSLEIWLIPSDQTSEQEEIVITGKREKRPAAGRAEVSVNLVSKEEILESAGALEDPVRLVGTLPGALPASELTPLFFVRGGAVYESFFYLDDAIIYNPFQVGGGATIFNPSLIDDMKFYAGGHGAEYPGSLSGVLDIRYRDPAEDRLHGSAELSVISTNLDLEGPTFDGGPSFLLSFRRSNFEIPLAVAQALDAISDNFAAPAFVDVYARLHQRLARGHTLTLSGFITDDGLDLVEFDPDDVGGFGGGSFFYKNRTYAAILSYRGEFSDHLLQTATFSSVSNSIDAQATGDNPMAVDSRVHSVTLRSDWVWKVRDEDNLMWGWFANRTQADILANSPDFRRFVMGLRIGGDVNVKNLDMDMSFPFFMTGLYLKKSWSFLGDRLVLEPGIRVSYEKPSDELLVEPRAALRIRLAPGLQARAATGLYSQPVLNPLATDPDFGAPRLTAERAVHLIGGIEWTPFSNWQIRAEAFIKTYDHLVTNSDDVAGYLSGRVESFTSEGTGGAYGGDLFIEKRGSKWSGWLSYGYLVAWRHNPRLENEYADASDLSPSQDIPHTLALVLFYRPNANWKFSLRMLAHSGNRYTPLDPEDPFRIELDANDDRPIWRINPDLSRLNGNRAPFYFKTDLRGSHTWLFENWSLEIYLDLMNAQVRKNTLMFAANRGRPPEKEPRYGPIFELPIIPFVGARGKF